MERIIKFRAWDKQRKEMFAVNSLNAYADNRKDNSLQVRRFQGDMPEDFELLQFTGLLDVEGKRVYEGYEIKALNCKK